MGITVIFDAETDNLLRKVTVCWCISVHELETNSSAHYGPNEIQAALSYLYMADCIIGHNIKGYDLPMFKKLYGWVPNEKTMIIDTMIMDMIRFPEERHGLDALAERFNLKQQKVKHEDWSRYSEEMKWRCDSDVIITKEIYLRLLGPADGSEEIPWNVLSMEQDISELHSRQAVHGVKIDITRGMELYKELSSKLDSLEKKITEGVPPETRIQGISLTKAEDIREEFRLNPDNIEDLLLGQKATKANKQYTANNIKYFGKGNGELEELWEERDVLKMAHSLEESSVEKAVLKIKLAELGTKEQKLVKGIVAEGPYNKIESNYLNLRSPAQVSKYLLEQCNWKPTEWNSVKDPDGTWRKTGPQLTEDSFASIKGGAGPLIAEYNILKHRKSVLLTIRKKDNKPSGILALTAARGDQRISADGFTLGTPTGRYRHFGIVNLPGVKSPYGKEIRSLLVAPEGSWLLGVDLSGVEARILGHYVSNYQGGEVFVDDLLEGDIHQLNAEMWGVDRDTAKSILYATFYGAGPAKIGSICGRSDKAGKKIKEDFYDKYPAIRQLIKSLEKSYGIHGDFIITIDGRKTYIRSAHKLLNSLIQSCGSVILKHWTLAVDKILPSNANQVLSMHDEILVEYCGDRQPAEKLMAQIIEQAGVVGEHLGITVPIDADGKIGKSYAEVH